MKLRFGLTALVLVVVAVLVAGCGKEEPTPTTAVELPATATPTVLPVTNTPMPTPLPIVTDVPEPTPVPLPTATFPPTPTPIPLVEVLVTDAGGQPVVGATVRLVQDELGYDATYTTLSDGRAVFAGLQPSPVAYRVEAGGTGFRPATTEVIVGESRSEVSLILEQGVVARINTILANLRSQPNLGATIVAEVPQGAVLSVIAVSNNGEWLQVVTDDGVQGWLFAELATVEGDLSLLAGATPAPAGALPTAEGTAQAATPVPGGAAGPPQGPNLVLNPGFEDGNANWLLAALGSVQVVSSAEYPMFVYEGQHAAQAEETTVIHQTVFNVTPGTTYRFTAWGRIWSSDGEDRSVSDNPGNLAIYVCINTNADDNPSLPTSICSNSGRPLDLWQNFAVDAVATTERLSVLLVSNFQSGPANNLTLWDGTALGISPAPLGPTPTPTVVPEGTPTRPDPISFEPVAFRENIDSLRVVMEQMGGLLDRVFNGEEGSCDEYTAFYRQVVEITTYNNIPAEWQGIYDLYIDAADNVIATSDSIISACAVGGDISPFSLQVARSGIIDSINTLNAAATAADVLLSQQQ
jgi:hypothetical protein